MLAVITVNTRGDENDGIAVGGISLRDAIVAAAPGDTIDFAVAGTIALEHGQLDVPKNLTINGPGADRLTVRETTDAQIFYVSNATGVVTISGLSLTGAHSTSSGGAIVNYGSLTLSNCTVRGNDAGWGGGIANYGQLTVVGSTISGNRADGDGGGVWNGGTLTLISSTVAENFAAASGGGIYSVFGDAVLRHSTVVRNHANDSSAPIGLGTGGGIHVDVGTATLNHTIVAANTAGASDVRTPDDVNGSVNASYSIVQSASGATITDAGGTLVGVDPLLGGFTDNGGTTYTYSLLPGSPAIDAGDPSAVAGVGSVPAADQRGAPYGRIADGDGVGGGRIDIGAFELQALAVPRAYVVDSLLDESDGDFSAGHLSLREAIELANANAGAADTITFAPSIVGGTIALEIGQLVIGDPLSIECPSDSPLTIEASDSSRVLSVTDGHEERLIEVTISGLKLVNGDVAGKGGGIFNSENLTIKTCTIGGNSASGDGGGIFHSAGVLRVIDSTISGNSATGDYGGYGAGGGVAAVSYLSLVRSLVYDNSANDRGGGVLSQADLKISDSTISGNHAIQGGGVEVGRPSADASSDVAPSSLVDIRRCTITANSMGGISIDRLASVVVNSSIIAGNQNGDVSAVSPDFFQSGGWNLIGIGNGKGSFTNHDTINVLNPGLNALRNNGGPTMTYTPALGSPAIDAGDPVAVAGSGGIPQFDQRGAPYSRVFAAHGAGAARIDIGATEWQEWQPAATLVVDTLADVVDGDYSAGNLALREAVELSSFFTGPNVIEFAPALTSGGPASITLTHGELVIADSLTIHGAGANSLTIDAAGNLNQFGIGSRVFNVDNGSAEKKTIVISGLKLQGGKIADSGGAILNHEDLTVDHCTISNNIGANNGGGIYNDGYLTVVDSTIENNSADAGGGVSTISGSAQFHLERSTISGNHAKAGGGVFVGFGPVGIENSTISGNGPIGGTTTFGGGLYCRGGNVSLTNVTITANSVVGVNGASAAGGGLYVSQLGAVSMINSLVAMNAANPGTAPDVGIDASGGLLQSEYSLIGNSGGTLIDDLIGSLIGSAAAPIDPMLGPLANNGGSTRTHALLSGSLAIDAGDPATAAGGGAVPLRDQRGEPYTRVFDGDHSGSARVDIGAFELQDVPNPIGDYNRNALVDAGDYVLWRKTLGTSVSNYTIADGNGDGGIGVEDYAVWRTHFGATSPGVGGALSESVARIAAIEASTADADRAASVVAVGKSTGAARDLPLQERPVHRSTGVLPVSRSLVMAYRRREDALLAWLGARGDFGTKSDSEVDVRDGSAFAPNEEAADCAVDELFEDISAEQVRIVI